MARNRRSFWRAREHLQGAGESHQDVDEALPRSLHPELHQDFAGHTEPPKGAGESRSSWAQAAEKFCFHPSELCCGSGAVRRPSPPHIEERSAPASSRTSQLDALLSHVFGRSSRNAIKTSPFSQGRRRKRLFPKAPCHVGLIPIGFQSDLTRRSREPALLTPGSSFGSVSRLGFAPALILGNLIPSLVARG